MEEVFKELLRLNVQNVVTESKEDRALIAAKMEKLIKKIHINRISLLDWTDDMSKRSLRLVRENKELKKDLKYFKIAAGYPLYDQLAVTVDCMKQAVALEKGGDAK